MDPCLSPILELKSGQIELNSKAMQAEVTDLGLHVPDYIELFINYVV